MQAGGERQELKELVVEASQALARLDAGRLEELAFCCELLNRELQCSDAAGHERLAREAREAAGDMAIYARVLEATRNNVDVMRRLRKLRAGSLEYDGPKAQGWTVAEGIHGND